MAEQLALDELAGDGGAVEGDERGVGARREVVDQAGDELLSGAGLAEHQDAQLGGRDPLRADNRLAKRQILADQHLGGGLGDRLLSRDREERLPHPDAGARDQLALLDPDAVDEGAVGALEVAEEHPARVGALDDAMAFGDEVVAEHEVVGIAAADGDGETGAELDVPSVRHHPERHRRPVLLHRAHWSISSLRHDRSLPRKFAGKYR